MPTEPSNRNVFDVLSKIEDVCPTEWEARFTKCRRDLAYIAPELVSIAFAKVGECVTQVVGPPPLKEDWQVEAVAILMDKSAEDIRARYGVDAKEAS